MNGQRSPASLLERDASSLWHPYTQHGLGAAPLPVRSARGAYLELEDGQTVLDAISSWWVNIHGHGEPRIAAAIAEQFARVDHVLFAGFTHEPGIRLAEVLLSAARAAGMDADKAFYSDNGSTAVEAALKIAYQFHRNRGDHARHRFLALRGSYHGDTFGAMAVSEPDGFHALFRPLLTPVDFVRPGEWDDLQRRFERDGGTYAGLIVEPLIQGAAGMRTYPADYLRAAADLARRHGALLVCDEVFTGFYRTGTCFAFEQAGVRPDLLCLSKGITGGVLPLAATLASAEVFDAFLSEDVRRAFLHGHSYTANPLACAAALASWEILSSPGCQSDIAAIARATRSAIDGIAGHPGVEEARCLGTIGAVTVREAGDYFDGAKMQGRLKAAALQRGVLLRPLGNVIYAVPPYCATEAEIRRIYRVIEEIIDHAAS